MIFTRELTIDLSTRSTMLVITRSRNPSKVAQSRIFKIDENTEIMMRTTMKRARRITIMMVMLTMMMMMMMMKTTTTTA